MARYGAGSQKKFGVGNWRGARTTGRRQRRLDANRRAGRTMNRNSRIGTGRNR